MSIVAATQNDANKETNDKIIGFEDELKKEKTKTVIADHGKT